MAIVETSAIVTTYLALLRGVNVGGHKLVAMSELRELLSEMGFIEPRSLLQSGNLVFGGAARSATALERLLESAAGKRLALEADVFVRTAREWKTMIAHNPFREEAERDPGHLLVTFLKDAPSTKAVDVLRASVVGPEVVRAEGRHAYIVYPAGVGRSRLTNAVIEKTLGTRATARNWNTVRKLAALAAC